MSAVRRRSFERDGRLVPRTARGLRARAVTLKPHGVMDWHSTQAREELVIVLVGCVILEVQQSRRIHRLSLAHGHCALLPARTTHRVVNDASRRARYLYVTGLSR